MKLTTDGSCDCVAVAAASVLSYRQNGYEADVRPLVWSEGDVCVGQLVTVTRLRLREVVLDSESFIPAAAEALSAVGGTGWSALAVVPLPALGEARMAFNGSADFVQGWWAQDESRTRLVGFTEPEIV